MTKRTRRKNSREKGSKKRVSRKKYTRGYKRNNTRKYKRKNTREYKRKNTKEQNKRHKMRGGAEEVMRVAVSPDVQPMDEDEDDQIAEGVPPPQIFQGEKSMEAMETEVGGDAGGAAAEVVEGALSEIRKVSNVYFRKYIKGKITPIEKTIYIKDISNITPDLHSAKDLIEPNIVECIDLTTVPERWDTLHSEYKYNESFFTKGPEPRPPPQEDHNWVIEKYLTERGEDLDNWNISGLIGGIPGIRLVGDPCLVDKGDSLIHGASSVPDVHFDAYEGTNKEVLFNNYKYYNNEIFNNLSRHMVGSVGDGVIYIFPGDNEEDVENYIFLNVWILFKIEPGAENITNYNLCFGHASGHPGTPDERKVDTDHVIRVPQKGDYSPNVYFLKPLKSVYRTYYTKMNMKVGEAYVFDSRYTPHFSCNFPDAPSNSVRGSAELRFIISRKKPA
jgi:hypothetical protein